MALKMTVDTLDGIPDALKGEYTEKDGKFHLGLEGLEDGYVPKDVHQRINNESASRRRQIAAWEKLGKTPEEVSEMLAAHEEAERKKDEANGDHAKILKQHQDKWDKEKVDLEAELGAARSSERGAIIENRVLTALTKAKATDEGMDLLPDRLSNRIKFETVDGKRIVKIMQADGETPMAGAGKDGEATFDDLAVEAAKKWPSLFQGSGNSGSGKEPGRGGGANGAKTMTRAELRKLSPAEQSKIFAEGKITVVD